MADDGILSTIVGALPGIDLSTTTRVVEVDARRPSERDPNWRSRLKGPRKRWTRRGIAEHVGVSEVKLIRLLRDKRSTRARLLLGLKGDCAFSKTEDRIACDDDVWEAAKLLVDIMERDANRWTRLWLKCRTCGTTKVPNKSRGVCISCVSERKRRAAGMKPKQPFKGKAWDPVHGLIACHICHRTKYRHTGAGRCGPCSAWHGRFGVRLDERAYVAAVTKKRLSLNKPWRGVVARDTKTGAETTFTVRRDLKTAGFNVTLVDKCLRGERETHAGCMFRYVDE